jgi:large subunit ribosomal protein L13
MGHLKLTRDTYTAKPADIERRWYVVDADGQVLGRLASAAAQVLRGKHKPIYTRHMDTGDHVIVVNARKVVVTGGKADKKKYLHHSGYPGGLKETPYEDLIKKHPEQVLIMAVRGMLPHNRLGRAMLGKLHVYAGPEHRHQAQKPEPMKIGD